MNPILKALLISYSGSLTVANPIARGRGGGGQRRTRQHSLQFAII